jgi:sarcosine oxidase subunit gamma
MAETMTKLAKATPPAPDFARPGCSLALDAALAVGKIRLIGEDFAATFGFAPPPPRTQIDRGGVTIAWLAPGEWLVTGAEAAVAATLAKADGELGLGIDISDGRSVLVLTGAEARTALAAVSALDVSDRAFAVGGVARTMLGGSGMFLARLADVAGAPCFRIIVDQTMTHYAARMLSEPGRHQDKLRDS